MRPGRHFALADSPDQFRRRSLDRRALEKRGVVPRPKSGRIREDEVAEVLFFGQLVLTSS